MISITQIPIYLYIKIAQIPIHIMQFYAQIPIQVKMIKKLLNVTYKCDVVFATFLTAHY